MADTKVSALTALTALDDADKFYVVDADGGGSPVEPASRAITLANLKNAVRSHRGALVKLSADLTAQNLTTGAAVAFDSEEYDTDAIHDNVTNNSRLTVPAGVAKVRLVGQILLNNVSSSVWLFLGVTKNGSTNYPGAGAQSLELSSAAGKTLNASTAVLQVSPGDFFELFVQTEGTDTSVDISALRTSIAMEIVE